LIRDLAFQITEIEETGRAAETSLRKTASDVLRADDKLLANLQTLATDNSLRRIDEHDTVQIIRELCARYISFPVQNIVD
jgi:hypothetical protein